MDFIVNLPKKLKESVLNKSNSNTLNNSSLAHDDYSFLVKSMINYSNQLAELIKNNHLILEEYYDFLEIQQIMEMVLKEDINKIDDIELKLLSKILDAIKEINDVKFVIVNKKYNISKDKKFILYLTYLMKIKNII
jgi:hypothetical protein